MSRATRWLLSVALFAGACSKDEANDDVPHHAAPPVRTTAGTQVIPRVPSTPSVEHQIAPARRPQRNPYLSAETYALSHFDPAQTDSIPYPAPRGVFHADLRRSPRVDHGPVNILTAAAAVPGFMWAISSGGAAYVDVSNGGFREVARLPAPGVKVIPPGKLEATLGQEITSSEQATRIIKGELGLDWTRIGNGVYSLVDRDNHLYYNTFDGTVIEFGLKDPNQPSAGIEIVKARNFHDVLRRNENIAGLTMTYDGDLVVLGSNSVSVLERTLEGPVQTIRLARNERITNSAAIDEMNGIYVASDKSMHRFVWTGSRLSGAEADGAWTAAYDRGHQPPAVKIGTGTGSTPTLMGFGDDPDKLVVITDGSDRMKLVAFWRGPIPSDAVSVAGALSPRIAGQTPVTCGLPSETRFIQSEQSVVVNGYGAFVVNNIAAKSEPDLLVGVVALGPVNQPARGVERFEWDPQANIWRSVWSRDDVISTSMVPAVSTPTETVFVNGYTAADGWELTGLDWNSGATVHRTLFGHDNLGNGAYALIQFFPNGDLLFNGIAGPTRVALRN